MGMTVAMTTRAIEAGWLAATVRMSATREPRTFTEGGIVGFFLALGNVFLFLNDIEGCCVKACGESNEELTYCDVWYGYGCGSDDN